MDLKWLVCTTKFSGYLPIHTNVVVLGARHHCYLLIQLISNDLLLLTHVSNLHITNCRGRAIRTLSAMCRGLHFQHDCQDMLLHMNIYIYCHFKNTPVVVNNPIDNELFLKVD